jgi:hypothetical protein
MKIINKQYLALYATTAGGAQQHKSCDARVELNHWLEENRQKSNQSKTDPVSSHNPTLGNCIN